MKHPITPATRRLTIEQPFDYLSPGVVYRATPDRDYVRIDRDDESSGTFIRPWQWERLKAGEAGAMILPYATTEA